MARKRVVRSPDGRVWSVTVSRFRAPRWRESDYDPLTEDDLFVFVVFAYLYAIVVWYVVPLATVIAELPVAFARSLFSSRRWIEARSNDTSPIVALWSADRRDAQLVAEELAESLATGYEWSSPAGAEFVEMTEPPGHEDHD